MVPDSKKALPPDFDPFGPRPGWGDGPPELSEDEAKIRLRHWLKEAGCGDLYYYLYPREAPAGWVPESERHEQQARDAMSRFNEGARASSVADAEKALVPSEHHERARFRTWMHETGKLAEYYAIYPEDRPSGWVAPSPVAEPDRGDRGDRGGR